MSNFVKTRRLQRMFLMVLSFILTLIVSAQVHALSENEAKEFIYQHIEEQYGYVPESYDFAQVFYADNAWGFSAQLKEHPSDEDGLIVGSINERGELIEIHAPEKISLDRQIENDLKACFYTDQGLEKMYAFRQKWRPAIQAMLDAGTPKSDIPVFEKYLDVIFLNIGLPAEGDISKEEALERAKETLGALPGWTREKADFFDESIELYHVPKEPNLQFPVYHFFFERYSLLGDMLGQGLGGYQNYEDYEKDLFAAFGGDNESTPYYVSVMINAQTGEPIEPPVIAIPPIREHYLDFVLR